MGNFNRDNRGGRGGGFGGNRGGGFGGDRDRTMHKATCSSCGKECEVPFRPSGDKPVYCNDCFSKTSAGSDRAPRKDFGDRAPRRDFGSRPQQRPSFDGSNQGGSDTKRQLEAISAKLDKLTQAIENFSQSKKAGAKATEKAAPKAAPKAVVKAPTKKAVKKVVVKKGKK